MKIKNEIEQEKVYYKKRKVHLGCWSVFFFIFFQTKQGRKKEMEKAN